MAQIVLLEDDETLSGLLCASLEAEGHEVVAFTTVAAAFDYFRDHTVELIIADLFMRLDGKIINEGGLTLMSRVRQQVRSDIPIIAISGAFSSTSSNEMVETAKLLGANAVLAKPFQPAALSELIVRLLEG